MSIPSSLENARRTTALAPVLLAALVLACADAGGDSGSDAGSSRVGVTIDPCALLTNEELSEELILAVSPSQRATWTASEFIVSGTAANWGETRACEYEFESRQGVGHTPARQGGFTVSVSPAGLVLVPENERLLAERLP